MVFKIALVALLAVFSQAAHYDNQGATSHVTFNNEHNIVHHIQSAPIALKSAHSYSAPVHSAPTHGYATPSHAYAAPAVSHTTPVHSHPNHNHAQSYASFSASSAHHASPVANYVSSGLHYQAPAVHGHYDAHVTKIAAPVVFKAAQAPVAKIVTPVVPKAAHHHHEEEYAPAKYEFSYNVEDHHTGDIHSHKEARNGDITHGEYSLHEADGTIRTVKYTVDKHSGFNAVVENSGHPTHPQQSHHGYHH